MPAGLRLVTITRRNRGQNNGLLQRLSALSESSGKKRTQVMGPMDIHHLKERESRGFVVAALKGKLPVGFALAESYKLSGKSSTPPVIGGFGQKGRRGGFRVYTFKAPGVDPRGVRSALIREARIKAPRLTGGFLSRKRRAEVEGAPGTWHKMITEVPEGRPRLAEQAMGNMLEKGILASAGERLRQFVSYGGLTREALQRAHIDAERINPRAPGLAMQKIVRERGISGEQLTRAAIAELGRIVDETTRELAGRGKAPVFSRKEIIRAAIEDRTVFGGTGRTEEQVDRNLEGLKARLKAR